LHVAHAHSRLQDRSPSNSDNRCGGRPLLGGIGVPESWLLDERHGMRGAVRHAGYHDRVGSREAGVPGARGRCGREGGAAAGACMGLSVSSIHRRHSIPMRRLAQRGRTVMQAWRSEGSSPLAVRVSRRELVCGGPRGTRTMMRPCASAAKLRGGGPILHRGSAAMLPLGSPPPRTVIGQPSRGRDGAPKLLARDCVRPSPSRRAQDEALRHLAGGRQLPQPDERLPRQRHDQRLARAAAGIRGPRPVPPRERAVLLVEQAGGAGGARPAGSCRGAPGHCPLWQVPSPAASTRSRPVIP
jgi:hypothetical protein